MERFFYQNVSHKVFENVMSVRVLGIDLDLCSWGDNSNGRHKSEKVIKSIS